MRPFLLCILLALSQAASAANTLTADEAKNHIGENATVYGVVAGTHYAEQTKGSPTFVNLDKPYPNQLFTILVWDEDLPKFSPKPSAWEGKRVCATGTITSYRGSPEIVAKAPGQVTVQEARCK
jgi:DNA/RNA endonuclease YhcR with UshA esterase domain